MREGREKWIPGTIVQIKGPSSYTVRVPGNKHRFVHTDHLMHDDVADYLPRPQSDVHIPDPLPVPGISDHIPQVQPKDKG